MRGAWIAAICLLATYDCGFCQNRRCTAGVCVSGFITGCAEIQIEYAFGKHWSAAAEACLGFSRLFKENDMLEKEHDSEFSFQDLPHMRATELFTEYIQGRYWISDNSRGAYLSAGLKHGNRSGVDWTIGVGYRMYIWRGISVGTEYRTGIIKAIKTGNLATDGIRIYLNYTLGK